MHALKRKGRSNVASKHTAESVIDRVRHNSSIKISFFQLRCKIYVKKKKLIVKESCIKMWDIKYRLGCKKKKLQSIN